MKARDAQYTIRGVPRSVDRALRRKAREQGKSLNAFVIEALRTAAGVAAEAPEHHDLDAFIGSWVEDPETEAALREQRTIDEADWR
jgi:hypothetical protein